MNGERLKKLKETLLAVSLVAVMATNSTVVSAAIPEKSIEHNVDDEKDEKARTSADWKKIKEAYKSYDCNLDTDSIEALLEIEDFIEKNYGVYYDDELSKNFTVDDVISYRSPYYIDANGNEVKMPFSYNKLISAYDKLDMKDDKAVAAFLKQYGKYLADLHAHNYFTIITTLSAIRNDLSWYVRQDVENSDISDLYGYTLKEVQKTTDAAGNLIEVYESKSTGGELSSDLTTLTIHYPEVEVTVDITAPNDGSPIIVFPENDVPDTERDGRLYGDGFIDIQTVHTNLLIEAFNLEKYFEGTLKNENIESFLGYSTFKTNGTTVDANNETDQVYSIEHNEKINELIREGLRVVKTLSPDTTYDAEELYELGVDVTALGYGHWITEEPVKSTTTLDKNGQPVKKDLVSIVETFECPTLTIEEVRKQHPNLTYKSNKSN